jgi:nicotinamide-nucleotide amidase
MNAAVQVFEVLRRRGLKLATAESCTGGMVASAMTDIAGSSEVFDRGFVTYSNDAKSAMLAVPAILIADHGAVSAEVAVAMAEGALTHSQADIAIAITGIAGPTGGNVAKPVGLVHFACAMDGADTIHIEKRFGNLSRAEIRTKATESALGLVLRQLEATP